MGGKGECKGKTTESTFLYDWDFFLKINLMYIQPNDRTERESSESSKFELPTKI